MNTVDRTAQDSMDTANKQSALTQMAPDGGKMKPDYRDDCYLGTDRMQKN